MEIIGFVIFLLFIILKSVEKTKEKQKQYKNVQRRDYESTVIEEVKEIKNQNQKIEVKETNKNFQEDKKINYKKSTLASSQFTKSNKKPLNNLSFSGNDFVKGVILSEIIQPPLSKRTNRK